MRRSTPYAAVLASYEQRIRSSWTEAVVVLNGVVFSFLPLKQMPTRLDTFTIPVLMALIGTLFFAPRLWMQFQEQMLSPGRRLRPDYARPHVVIFTIISILLALGWPAVLMVVHRSSSLVLMGTAVAFFAYIGWFVIRPSIWLLLLGVTALGGIIYASQTAVPGGFARQPHETLAAILLIGGCIATAMAIWRLATPTDDDNGKRIQGNTWNQLQRPRMTGDVARHWADLDRRQKIPWLRVRASAYLPTDAGLWEASKRWRSTIPNMLRFLLIMPAAIGLSNFFIFYSSRSSLPASAVFLVIMPTMSLCFSWFRQWNFMECDTLRPIARSDVLKGIGLAIAVGFAQAWLASMGVVVLLCAAKQAFDFRQLGLFLSASFGLQILMFGVYVWILRYRSITWLFTAYIAIFIPTMIASNFLPNLTNYPMYILLTAMGMACAGAVIACAAYRKWLVTELG